MQPYDESVLKKQIKDKKYYERKKQGKSGASLGTKSTFDDKQGLFTDLFSLGTSGTKKGQDLTKG